MSALPKRKRVTVEEYLAAERTAEFKSEYYYGVVVPLHHPTPQGMAGASKWHNTVKENLIVQLGLRLLHGSCRSYSSDQKVQLTPTGVYAYPDIVIVCGRPEFAEADDDVLINPHAVIEVLSPSTENLDRGFKFAQYQRQPTLREYVLVAQDSPRIERYVRQADGDWLMTVFADATGEFELATLPIKVPLADVYRDVEFPSEPEPPL